MQTATKLILSIACGLALGCAGARMGGLPTAQQLTADPAGQARLARGRALVFTECTACHRLYAPDVLPEGAWPATARHMGQRAHLSGEDAQAVGDYYLAARRALSAATQREP